MSLLNHAVSVALTSRQHKALRDYTHDLTVSMSEYVRALIVDAIPPDYWGREEPPPGQMSLVEDEQ